jgi:hypothetical protein
MTKVVNITGTRCPSKVLAKFDKWYSENHIPDMMAAFPRLKKATRYKLAGTSEIEKFKISGAKQKEYPMFITIYEFDSKKDFDDFDTDPALNAAREDWVRIAGETGAEVVFRAQYEYMKTFAR